MIRVLERGDVCFFFRPAVQPADALETQLGVQSFFLVLSPAGRERHRRVRVGRKRMPAAAGERLWARVERAGTLDRVLAAQLEAEHYHTKTRGDRYQPGARPVAQGCYAFVQHDDHCHLAYRVDHVEDDAPEEVRVAAAGSYIVLFEREPPGRAVWTTDGDPVLLDEEGAELVLVGAGDEPEAELGIDVLPASEKFSADEHPPAR